MGMLTSKTGLGAVCVGLGIATLILPTKSQAQAQSASAAAMLEEIVVTARRREESLQDLPLSVAAISADAMQAQGIYDVMDISDFVPNVNFTNTDRRGVMAIFIRGIGNDSPGALQPVGAGVYLDGHYLPNTVGNMLNTVDIERIEILRGPQGTLFGKNTTGGAIQIITTKPQPEFEADVRIRAGSYGTQEVRGMVNIPFSDTVAGRFSAATGSSDGFFYNRTLNEDYGKTDVNAFSGALRFTPDENWMIDVSFRGNYQDEDNAGGQCRPYPTQEQVDNLAGLNPAHIDDEGRNILAGNDPAVLALHPAQIYTGPTYANGVSQWGGDTNFGGGVRANIGGHIERLFPGATIAAWNDCLTDNAMGPYVVSSEKRGFLDLENENFNTTIQWDSAGAVGALENLNIKMIASTHETRYNYFADRDYTSLSIDAIGTAPHGSKGQVRTTDSLELLFTADVSDRLNVVFGAHYFDDNNKTGDLNCWNTFKANQAALTTPPEIDDPNSTDPADTIPNPAFTNFSIECQPDGGTQFDRLADRMVSGGPEPAGMSGYITSESVAVFAHMEYSINDDWTLDLGARWTDEDRGFHQIELQTAPGTCTHNEPGDPPTTDICQPDYILSFESAITEGFFNDTTANFSEVTPTISLTRHLAGGDTLDSGNVYFTISEGFLSGAFNDELNTTLVPELASLLTYQPEHVTNYELGFKGTFNDGLLRFAGDIFYMKYEDKQEQIDIDNADGRFGGDPQVGIVTNAATVDIIGIEAELRLQPWDGGFITFDFSYLDDDYGEFNSFDPDSPGGTIDRSGLTIADYAPDMTINFSIEHAFQLSNGATLTPLLGMYWQDDYEWIGAIDATGPRSACFQEAYAKLRARLTYEPADGNWQAALYGSNIGDKRYFEYCDEARSGIFDYRYGAPDQWGAEFTYRWGS